MIMTEPAGRLTAAQKRAIEWLPADGSWRVNAGRLVSALNSLSHAWPMAVESQWGPFGPKGGHICRWRFNEKGVKQARVLRELRT